MKKFESAKDVEKEIAEQERTLEEQKALLAEAEEQGDEANLWTMQENVEWTERILEGLRKI